MYICNKVYLVRGFNIGAFLHQQLCNFNMAMSCCPMEWCLSILCMNKTRQKHYLQSNITKQKNISILHTIQFPIGHTSHSLLVEGHVSCFIACAFQCIKLIQNHKLCTVCSPHQSHISAVQRFPHIVLAHALIQPNVPILCTHTRNLFSISNLDYECSSLCTIPLQMPFMQSKNTSF